jgi:hypothetical protein
MKKDKALIIILSLLLNAFIVSTTANFKPYVSPETKISSPTRQSIWNTNDIPLNVTIQLFGYHQGGIVAEGLEWLNYSIDGYAGFQMPITALPNNYWPTPVLNGTGSVMLSDLADGKHWVKVFGKTSFNTTFSTDLIPFTVDTTSPTISILSQNNSSISSEPFSLNFTTNEQTSWLAYSLDNGANKTINSNITLTELNEGLHMIIFYANDTLGNMGVSQEYQFTVTQKTQNKETQDPFPILMIVFGVLVASLCMVLVVYFKKRKHEVSHP